MTRPMTITLVKVDSVRLISILIALAAVAGFLVWTALPVSAHGEGLDVSPREAQPGESVTITGTGFPLGEEVEILLEGVRGEVDLGHFDIDENGEFSIELAVPDGVAAGTYQWVAATGDDSVGVDFTVLEGAVEARPAGGQELVFERTTSETIVIGIIAATLAVVGASLVAFKTRQHG